MAYTLVLQNRTAKDARTITIPVEIIRNFIDGSDHDKLWEYFERVSSNIESELPIHDKTWLEAIVNWVPDGGLAMTEIARWLKLARRVSTLDGTRETGNFTLSDYQVNLIWSRLKDPRFKLRVMAPQFVDFMLHFQDITGKHFEDEDPDDAPA